MNKKHLIKTSDKKDKKKMPKIFFTKKAKRQRFNDIDFRTTTVPEKR